MGEVVGAGDRHDLEAGNLRGQEREHRRDHVGGPDSVDDRGLDRRQVVGRGCGPGGALFLDEGGGLGPLSGELLGGDGRQAGSEHEFQACAFRIVGGQHHLHRDVGPVGGPRSDGLVADDRFHQFGRTSGHAQGVHATERMTCEHGPASVEEGDQVVDVLVDADGGTVGIGGGAIAAAVVPRHPALAVEAVGDPVERIDLGRAPRGRTRPDGHPRRTPSPRDRRPGRSSRRRRGRGTVAVDPVGQVGDTGLEPVTSAV